MARCVLPWLQGWSQSGAVAMRRIVKPCLVTGCDMPESVIIHLLEMCEAAEVLQVVVDVLIERWMVRCPVTAHWFVGMLMHVAPCGRELELAWCRVASWVLRATMLPPSPWLPIQADALHWLDPCLWGLFWVFQLRVRFIPPITRVVFQLTPVPSPPVVVWT